MIWRFDRSYTRIVRANIKELFLLVIYSLGSCYLESFHF